MPAQERIQCVECDETGWATPGFTGWRCWLHRGQKGQRATVGEAFAPAAEPPLSPHAGSPYRCRAHHEVRVDRRGKGCHECADERRPRRQPRLEPLEIQ